MTDTPSLPGAAAPVAGAVRLPLRFPSVVDGVTVRLVAATVLVISVLAIGTQQWWLYALLAADFVPRAMWGPSRSFLATGILKYVRQSVPAPPRPTAGAPKRFAAVIGAAMTSLAAAAWILHVVTGLHPALVVVWPSPQSWCCSRRWKRCSGTAWAARSTVCSPAGAGCGPTCASTASRGSRSPRVAAPILTRGVGRPGRRTPIGPPVRRGWRLATAQAPGPPTPQPSHRGALRIRSGRPVPVRPRWGHHHGGVRPAGSRRRQQGRR